MSDELRAIFGDGWADASLAFDKGLEQLCEKHADYFDDQKMERLSHYVTVHGDPATDIHTIIIDGAIPSEMTKEVMALFNSIYKQ